MRISFPYSRNGPPEDEMDVLCGEAKTGLDAEIVAASISMIAG